MVHMDIRKIPTAVIVVAAVALLALLLMFGRFCSTAATINVTVNGNALTIHGAKTMQTAIRESGLPINPGDFISLGGTVLKKSDGYPFAATVNGNKTANPDYELHEGDVIEVSDGDDRIEDYDSADEVRPHGGNVFGAGAICKIEAGADGITEVRTGRISGDVVRRVKQEGTNSTCTCYNPDVGEDKVIALTFDDGPSDTFTSEILDILRENNAHATFFCVGTKIENSANLVKRMRNEGHQVGVNAYARSWKLDESNDTKIDVEGLVNDVEYGQQALGNALDGEAPSRIIRLPNSALTGEMAGAIDTRVDASIGWNVDTGDWMEYRASQVYEVLMGLESGDIVLLHDGGGDRSATAEALEKALPRLAKLGYSFVTVDELIGYPAQ